MYTKKILLTLLINITLFATSLAQKPKLEYSGFWDSYYFRGPLAFSGGLMTAGYSGDLCGSPDCNIPKLGLNFGLNYRVWPRTVFGAEYSYFKLQAKDHLPARNISFKSTNQEFDLFARLYLIEDIVRVAVDRNKKPKKVKLYVHLGVGFLNYNPVSYGIVTDSIYLVKENKSYPRFTVVIPAGFGLSYSFSHRFQLLAEFAYKYSFSDYLDDVSARGNSTGFKDSYVTASLKLQYAPFAPKVKRKKKYKGQNPASGEGGGAAEGGPTTSPAAPVTPEQHANPEPAVPEQNPETPAPEQNPETPAPPAPQDNQQETPPTEK